MEILNWILPLIVIAIGFGVNRWQASALNPKQQIWINIGASLLLAFIIILFTTYSWTWILMGLVIAYSIYRSYKGYVAYARDLSVLGSNS